MTHLPQLIHDLALILVAAGVVSILCKWLKQPVVLGYILAGFLVGPHFKIFPTVGEVQSIHIWAEIGVIFLLFGLGLEFSFRKLAKVGPSASITAVVEIISMLGLGYLTGRALGWSSIDSLFLGGILSISSTTIIVRAFDELGLKSKKFVSLVLGSLIVEDLIAILLLVLLSTLAVSQQFEGRELLGKATKLGFFLILWFISGIFILPTLLKKTRRFLNDETMLIVSLALCLVMVLLASQAGFSPALGAFIMGSLLAETTEAEKIEHLTKPVKDLFAAVFFVSVGMLIDPQMLSTQAKAIFIISAVTIIGKTLSTTLGALISGQSLRHSVQSGFSLAQIGEFSFIIASLGLTLKVTSDFLYPIAVAVSALTTLTTPYLIKGSDRAAFHIEALLPKSWTRAIQRYSDALQRSSQSAEWRKLLRVRLLRVLVNSVLVVAIFWLSQSVVLPFILRYWGENLTATIVYTVLTLLAASPFLWAVAFGGSKAASAQDLLKEVRAFGPLVWIEVLRFFWALALMLIFIVRLDFIPHALSLLSATAVMIAFVFWMRLGAIYQWFESRFISNLNERERMQSGESTEPLAPWNAHLATFKVPAEANFVGQSLNELTIRERFGVTIAVIQRGQKRIAAPKSSEKLFPCDELGVIGNEDQLLLFEKFISGGHGNQVGHGEPGSSNAGDHGLTSDTDSQPSVLRSLRLGENSPFVGKIIRDSGLREKTNGLVVGIERQGVRILNPDSTMRLEAADLIWIVGDESRLREL